MRCLVACEYSGRVRDALIARGHDAVSCDTEPSDRPGPHEQRDVREILDWGWDMMIAFPPCTYLAASGARWLDVKPGRVEAQKRALDFVHVLMAAPIAKIAIENPVGAIGYYIRDADQWVQPWMFGHGETKKTGLWLKNLPKLVPTDVVTGREGRIHMMSRSKSRAKKRSLTFEGIAEAMASQWSTDLRTDDKALNETCCDSLQSQNEPGSLSSSELPSLKRDYPGHLLIQRQFFDASYPR